MGKEIQKALTEEKNALLRRARIEALVAEGVEESTDVPRLMELMRAYQVVGEEDSRMRIMRRLRDIPSAADLRVMAEAIVAAVKSAEGSVDVDRLREENAALFEVVESRREIRPSVIMEATGCGCSFAIEVLQAFWRIRIVTGDLGLGRRAVMVEKVVGKVALRKDPPTEETPKEREVREKALALLKKHGSLSVSLLQRELGLGYNRAAQILDKLKSS